MFWNRVWSTNIRHSSVRRRMGIWRKVFVILCHWRQHLLTGNGILDVARTLYHFNTSRQAIKPPMTPVISEKTESNTFVFSFLYTMQMATWGVVTSEDKHLTDLL